MLEPPGCAGHHLDHVDGEAVSRVVGDRDDVGAGAIGGAGVAGDDTVLGAHCVGRRPRGGGACLRWEMEMGPGGRRAVLGLNLGRDPVRYKTRVVSPSHRPRAHLQERR